jgi:hypothetical protein
MVAALSCNACSYYNDFVIKHRSRRQHYGKAIRGEFRRRYGRNGSTELNRFVTHLANEASARSNADQNAFCADALTLFEQAVARGTILASIVTTPTQRKHTTTVACDATTPANFHGSAAQSR